MKALLRRRAGVLSVLLLSGGAGLWLWRSELPVPLGRAGGGNASDEAAVQPSPELAESTLDRFEALRDGEGGGELRLGGAELSSLVRYALPGALPPGVQNPTVEVRDGHVHLAARLVLAQLPEVAALGDIVALLPDVVRVRVRGTVTPWEDGAALHVDRIDASGIPLPPRLISELLGGFGRAEGKGLPPEALFVPLPHGLRAAFVERDTLVLLANR